MPRFPLAASLFFLLLSAPAAANDAEGPKLSRLEQASPATTPVRLNTPSGYPVPRYVSLKTTKTYCRSGPSFDHPVKITFMRQGLPVVVVAETTDHWRKIADPEGDQCWAHRSTLSGLETALVATDGLAIRKKPFENAPAEAILGRGVIAEVEGKRGEWLRVSANGVKGWANRAGLWGAQGNADYVAAHN